MAVVDVLAAPLAWDARALYARLRGAVVAANGDGDAGPGTQTLAPTRAQKSLNGCKAMVGQMQYFVAPAALPCRDDTAQQVRSTVGWKSTAAVEFQPRSSASSSGRWLWPADLLIASLRWILKTLIISHAVLLLRRR